jgi:hypothetical protein
MHLKIEMNPKQSKTDLDCRMAVVSQFHNLIVATEERQHCMASACFSIENKIVITLSSCIE